MKIFYAQTWLRFKEEYSHVSIGIEVWEALWLLTLAAPPVTVYMDR